MKPFGGVYVAPAGPDSSADDPSAARVRRHFPLTVTSRSTEPGTGFQSSRSTASTGGALGVAVAVSVGSSVGSVGSVAVGSSVGDGDCELSSPSGSGVAVGSSEHPTSSAPASVPPSVPGQAGVVWAPQTPMFWCGWALLARKLL